MFLCQQIEKQTDRRYRTDYRAVWYKVAMNSKSELVWERYQSGKWRCHLLRFQQGTGRTICNLKAQERARRDFIDGVAEIKTAAHHKKVTPAEAAKLTGMAKYAAVDYLLEQDLDHPTVVKVPQKLKTEPKKEDQYEQKYWHARTKVEKYEKKISRYQKLLAKWSRRAKLYDKKRSTA